MLFFSLATSLRSASGLFTSQATSFPNSTYILPTSSHNTLRLHATGSLHFPLLNTFLPPWVSKTSFRIYTVLPSSVRAPPVDVLSAAPYLPLRHNHGDRTIWDPYFARCRIGPTNVHSIQVFFSARVGVERIYVQYTFRLFIWYSFQNISAPNVEGSKVSKQTLN